MLRSQASEPAAESITPIWCQAPDGVAEGVDAGLRVGPVLGQRREDDARRPIAIDSGPGRSTPTPRPARGLVAGARPRPARRRSCARDLGRLEHGRQPRGGRSPDLQHLVAPAPLRDVEQQRARGVGDVDRLSPVSRSRT
jgi:hypothetical protein